MVNLEKLNYSSDTGSEAIQKLDRNQRAIANAVNGMDVDSKVSEHNTSEEAHADIREQINVCMKKVDRNNVDLDTIFNTGTQGYCISCTNVPVTEDGVFFDYYTPFDDCGYQEFTGWSTQRKFFRYRKLGVWQGWQEIATSDTKPFTFVNGWKTVSNAYLNEATKIGKVATMNLIVYNEAQSSSDVSIGYTPFPPSKNLCTIGTTYDGRIIGVEIRTTGQVVFLTTVPTHSWLAINVSYPTL